MNEVFDVELCVISDEGYAVPTAVMLTSAKQNKHPDSRYRVHFVSIGLSDWAKQKISELSAPDFRIVFLESDVARYQNINIRLKLSHATIVKFDLPNLLPEQDKLLYLDGDLLITGDLKELYDTPLHNRMLAGVRDMGGERVHAFHRRLDSPHYINAGVLLINLCKLRATNAAPRLAELLQQHADTWVCLEQDAFNYAYKDDLLCLPLRYNATIPLFHNPLYHFSLEQVNDFYGTHYGDWNHLMGDALVIHFAGESTQRPWGVVNGSFYDAWQRYFGMSPYRNIQLSRTLLNWPLPPAELDDRQVRCPRVRKSIRLGRRIPLLDIHDTPTERRYYILRVLCVLTMKKISAKHREYRFLGLPIGTVRFFD